MLRRRIISILLCICTYGMLWKNVEQNIVFEFYDIAKQKVLNEYADTVILDCINMEKELLVENIDLQIAIKPKCENGYLNAIDFIICYNTRGYTDAIFEINHSIGGDVFNMIILDAYKITDEGLISILPQEARMGCKVDLFAECGWRVEEKIFSEPTQYMYVVQLFTIYPNTIAETEVFDILKQIRFEAVGYF